jgi:hypothetical protein
MPKSYEGGSKTACTCVAYYAHMSSAINLDASRGNRRGPFFALMKAKAKKNEGDALIKCLDELYQSRSNIQALAKLLGLCRWADPLMLDREALADAGEMIDEETERMREWMRRMEKELPGLSKKQGETKGGSHAANP